MRNLRSAAPLLLGLFLAAPGATTRVAAQPLEKALLEHPDPERADYYRASEAKIAELRAAVAAGPVERRLAALHELKLGFPDAALTTALTLHRDPETAVAVAAARLLASALVMSDHHAHHAGALLPWQQYVVERHEQARAALREALRDPRREVRHVAARMLLTLSDAESVVALKAGVAGGLYTDKEVVNYLGLAKSAVAGPALEPYLKTPLAKDAVVYLSAMKRYQGRIRDEVFLNPAASPDARLAAARVLSQYDPTYRSYALKVAEEPGVAPELFRGAIDAYVNKSQSQPLTTEQRKALEKTVNSYGVKHPEIDLERVRDRVK